MVILSQSWILLWNKNLIQNWLRPSITHIISGLIMDIAIPVVLVYIYLANFLKDRDSSQIKEIDPLQMKASMDNMISNMLLPLSFFLFCRKLVAQIVQEKQSGMLEYLKMNGMSQTAYNLSFVLHETFINGILICIFIDFLVYYRIERQHYLFKELFLFNLGILLFLMGVSAYALLISKLFNSPGFATQIGSMLYLVPILLTLFLKVLEMKHKFSKTANDQFFGQFEDDKIRQENIRSQMRLEGKINNEKVETDQNLQLYPFKSNNARNGEQILQDEPHYFEKISQSSLVLFPHSPFCDIATEVFLVYTAKNVQNKLLQKYFIQFFDFVLIMMVIILIENFKKIYKINFKENNQGQKDYSKNFKNGQFYENLNQNQDEKNCQEMVVTDANSTGLKKRQTQKNQSPQNLMDTSNYAHSRPINQQPFVQFQNMTKKFGSFTAVECLDLDLYQDEIFCFLGHNGAGKTTCLNVLMGKEKPSNGTVKLQLSNEGYNKRMLDIRYEFQKAQSFMGTCSQSDILFESLTVYQHIYLFYRLKTSLLINSDINQQDQVKVSEFMKKGVDFKVNELIKTVQLQDHSNVESQNLSGGLKRRLSIALALVSPIESSIVILDEPTTGLDAMVRDQVWQLIKQLKQNRCIVMTTQHLQEAEELADQVALLDLGKMVARGSVDDIKKKFGIGYNLIINHTNNSFENLKNKFEREALNIIKGSYFDEKNSTQDKSIYVLPFQTVSQFSQLFEYLEYKNIKFTLKQTSLEDAFLNFTNIQKINKNLLKQEQKFNQVEEDVESLIFENFKNFKNLDKNEENQSKQSLFWYQIKAMFLKRWYSFKRDWRMWLIMVIPSLFIWSLLAIGFKRDYTPVSPMKLTSQLLSNFTNQTNGTFQNKVLTQFDPDMISGLIRDLSQLSFHGDRNKSLNLTMMGQSFFTHSFANPSVENLLKDFLAFQNDTKDDQEEDQDFKEIKQIIKEVIQKDLNLSSPYDILMFGMKMMANQSNPDSNIEQMQQMTLKLQERIQGYYERKMMPFITQIAREQAELLMIEAIRYMKEIIYLIWMIFSLSQCSGIAVENPVMERQTKIRYYLNVIGLGQAAYWIGNFAFDMICFAIQAFIMVVMIYPLNLKSYQKDIGAFISLMCFFGPAHTLFSYFISFLFIDPNNALKFISIVYMISGFILPFVFKIISLGLDRCDGWVYSISSIISQGVPLQPMSTGLIDMLTRGHWGFFQEQKDRKNAETENRKAFFNSLGQQDIDSAESIFSDFQKCDGYVRNVETALWAMAISCIFSIVLLVIIERIKLLFYQSSEKSYSPSQKENDSKKILQTRNLKKTYAGNIQAVKGISIDIRKKKEILGLLGANGAGKSSTFNMVTMQIKRTSGDIRIFNQDISEIDYLEGINITAQHDILWPFISIEEHFQIISLIQGNNQYQNRYKCLTQKLELDMPHKYPNILSGGNKRKLCTGLTLLTGPELSFFDEPTVGLDPVARRNLLELVKSCGESVLFTTHRLDEAEYLCTRVAIMQNGKILYDGNIDDIKDSFQRGDISFETNNKSGKNKQICQGFILVKKPLIDLRKRIGYLEIEQEYSDQILYKTISNFGENQIRLSQIFNDLNNLRQNEQLITDFSYFEPSLHHIFVALNQERVKSD